ncbi:MULTISPECIES: GspE/PulE family protein [unclassified Bradyrhizobium]
MQRPSSAVGGRTVQMNGEDATDDIIGRIISYGGPVLTAPGGRLPTTSKQRDYIAVLDNGWAVISKSQAHSIEVAGVRRLIVQYGIKIDQVWLVDLEIIRRVYENYSARAADGGYTDKDAAQRQRDFMELVRAAASVNASDIHVVVGRHEAQIFVRVNGALTKMRDVPSGPAGEMLQAAFAMTDASDATYRPLDYQGARISDKSATVALPPGVQAIRLQYNPSANGGRYLVARLLYAQVQYGREEDVDELGYSMRQLFEIKQLRRKPTGINIVSGPTGSGKSTTLQRSLIALKRERPEVNIITIEDPPEYVIPGAVQLPVTNVKTEEERRAAFHQAIIAALRSDPDVIMIGEIRDRESALLAFQAAMTGHQVWCSLHANDAASCLDRLRDMHVELYKLTDPTLITGLIAQRLVRKLNPETRIDLAEAKRRNMLSKVTIRECERIEGISGMPLFFPDLNQERPYLGRTVVAEVIKPGFKFMNLFRQENKPGALQHWMTEEDGVSLVEHGIIKMLMGEAAAFEIEEKAGVLGDITDERVKLLVQKYVKGDGDGV